MGNEKDCSCCRGTTLVFACSGAADVGAIADQAARKLTHEGVGQMFCLAGIGGRVNGIMKTTAAADTVLAIDGCPLNCVKHCLEEAGFGNFKHLQLADLGLAKGASPMSAKRVDLVAGEAARVLSSDSIRQN
jgi:uncharacterized metal-binding protein